MTAIWEDMANSAVAQITKLQAENAQLRAELEQAKVDAAHFKESYAMVLERERVLLNRLMADRGRP